MQRLAIHTATIASALLLSGCATALAYKSFASDDLQPVAQPDERNLEAASVRLADNWPALFPNVYRRARPDLRGLTALLRSAWRAADGAGVRKSSRAAPNHLHDAQVKASASLRPQLDVYVTQAELERAQLRLVEARNAVADGK